MKNNLFYKYKNLILVILIFVLSFSFRLYDLQHTPPLLWDEAALGYNAYSILKTGKDEYGKLMPLIFKSFGDYKPGFYVYLTVPFVALFGLNELSVRLPSAILGSLTCVLLYIFLSKTKYKKIAFIASVLLSLNPFNIHFSRGAWETNVLTFELLLASYYFFRKKFFLSSFIFGLSLYTYQAGKLISLLLVISLLIINFSQLKKKIVFINFIIPLLIFALPIAYGLLFSHSGNRLEVVSLFSYERNLSEIKTIISESTNLDYIFFHNRYFFFAREFFHRYFNHFSPEYLAWVGDFQSSRHSAPFQGVLLWPIYISFILGFIISFKKTSTLNIYMLLWLIAAPIPAALTRDQVQSVRAMSLSLPLIYFASIGVEYLLSIKYLRLILITIFLFNFVYYSESYYHHLVKMDPASNLDGYKKATNYLIEHQNKFEHVYFTNFYGQPYIYYLFYSQYSPTQYQSQAYLKTDSVDTGIVEKIDLIQFSSPQFSSIKDLSSVLVVYSYDEIIRQGLNINDFIKLSPLFYAYQKL